jgi:hypothetical protein
MEIVNGIAIDRTVEGCSFGRLLVIGAAFRTRRSGSRTDWQVVASCDCGAVDCYYLRNLTTGMTTSCGCTQKERTRQASLKHGMRKDPLYAVWNAMRDRCHNPNNGAYGRYGGRGIKVCERWEQFENFFADMGQRPSPQHSIDRIDNNGDYCPENCRWATRNEQGKNKRNNILLTIDGETRHYTEWADLFGISRSTVLKRIRKGWPDKDCLKPSRKATYHKGT